MNNNETRDQFEAFKEEVKKAVESMSKAVEEKAAEWQKKAEEFFAGAKDGEVKDAAEEAPENAEAEERTVPEEITEAPEEAVPESAPEAHEEAPEIDLTSVQEDTGSEDGKDGSHIFRRTENGIEIDTDEIENMFRVFGDKLCDAFSSISKTVSDGIEAAQQKASQKKKSDRLAKLLPFMEEAEIHEIAEKVIAEDPEFKDVDLASLMPFMSEADLQALFEKSLALNDENPDADGKLYLDCVPYVGEEALSKLVDRYVEGGYQHIRMDNIYPYLSSQDVKRIFYYELKK